MGTNGPQGFGFAFDNDNNNITVYKGFWVGGLFRYGIKAYKSPSVVFYVWG